ncbi:hypothetical protein NAT02_08110 [Aeromonas hydrophila]|uniref:hypothetical protein n=1 Tax=Aeromonas hydrophila TaxID=644 RepID=UPI0020B35B9E|nr:hypothetical protein [Aeromonas hydrophila]MCP3242842.1 hypothetical protein [Aeromonas hydrophila]
MKIEKPTDLAFEIKSSRALLEILNVPFRHIVTSASNSQFSAIASAIGRLSTDEPINTLGFLIVSPIFC